VLAKKKIRDCHQLATGSGSPASNQQRDTQESNCCQLTLTASKNRYRWKAGDAYRDEQPHRHKSSKARAKTDESPRDKDMNQAENADQPENE